jgi:hypothetical protein
MRTFGRRQWIEIVLVAPATAVFVPTIVLGLFGMAATLLFSRQPLAPESVGVMNIMAGMAVAGLAGLASAWACILAGPEALRRRPLFRWAAVLGGAAALAVCGWLFFAIKLHPVNAGMLLLLGPALVGLGYLPALLAPRHSGKFR